MTEHETEGEAINEPRSQKFSIVSLDNKGKELLMDFAKFCQTEDDKYILYTMPGSGKDTVQRIRVAFSRAKDQIRDNNLNPQRKRKYPMPNFKILNESITVVPHEGVSMERIILRKGLNRHLLTPKAEAALEVIAAGGLD